MYKTFFFQPNTIKVILKTILALPRIIIGVNVNEILYAKKHIHPS